MKNINYKIYCLKHPISKEIRYIGITIRSLNERRSQHVYSGKHSPSTKVGKWIKSLLELKLIPEIELLEQFNNKNWEEVEIFWINKYKTNRLLNTHKGGKGVIIGKTREEANKNSAEAHKKKVCQFDKNNNLIKIWDSIKEASLFYNTLRSNISNASNKNYRTVFASGYKWQLYEDYINKIPLKTHKRSGFNEDGKSKGIIYLYDKNYNFIREFKNTVDTSSYLGCYPSLISENIKKNSNNKFSLIYKNYICLRQKL